jgi:hypothetical protein
MIPSRSAAWVTADPKSLPSSGLLLNHGMGTLNWDTIAAAARRAARQPGTVSSSYPPRYGCSAATAPPLIEWRDCSVLGQVRKHCR